MINSITKGIAAALNEEFNGDSGDTYKIYTEELRQGMVKPCFFIFCINPAHNLFLGAADGNRRYKHENQFAIQYIPEDYLGKRLECNEVSERLETCLEWVTADGDRILGSSMHHEMVDGVLHFFVNYNLFAKRTVTEEAMETVDVNQNVE